MVGCHAHVRLSDLHIYLSTCQLPEDKVPRERFIDYLTLPDMLTWGLLITHGLAIAYQPSKLKKNLPLSTAGSDNASMGCEGTEKRHNSRYRP